MVFVFLFGIFISLKIVWLKRIDGRDGEVDFSIDVIKVSGFGREDWVEGNYL